MKAFLSVVLFLGCLQPLLGQVVKTKAVVAAPAATTGAATEVVFNWAYKTAIPACASSLVNCYSGFTMTFANTNTVIATPSTLGPSSLSYSWVPAAGLPFGSLNFSLVANGYDKSGNALVSTPATVTVVNGVTSLDAPTAYQGATGTAQ